MKDLIVIGAGPGGYVAAIRAAQLGMSVTVVEKKFCGGTCLNVGCIPTKALYKDAQVVNYMKYAETYGIELKEDAFQLNMEKLQKEKNKIVKTLTGGVGALLKANKVELVMGTAKILSPGKVEVTDDKGAKSVLEAGKILIASGSKNVAPPVKGLDLPGVLSSTEALAMTEVPRKIVIVGGGVIGIEFVGIYNAFGADVTVVEFLPKILPPIDEEIAARSQMILENKGVKFMTGTKLESIEKSDAGLVVKADNGKEVVSIECDQVLVATGRAIDVEGMGLDKIGVTYDRKGIKVDENFETNVKGIYAIGDVIGNMMLAHVAMEEGTACVERMNGMNSSVNYNLVPSAVFTFPEIAGVGKTESQVKESGIAYKVGKFQLSGNGKALTMHDTDGMIKIIATENLDEILGVHIIGPNASDMLAEAAADMEALLTVEEAAGAMHGHPTLSEAYEETLTLLLGRGIHSMPVRKKK